MFEVEHINKPLKNVDFPTIFKNSVNNIVQFLKKDKELLKRKLKLQMKNQEKGAKLTLLLAKFVKE